jgi:hypothetical protein
MAGIPGLDFGLNEAVKADENSAGRCLARNPNDRNSRSPSRQAACRRKMPSLWRPNPDRVDVAKQHSVQQNRNLLLTEL